MNNLPNYPLDLQMFRHARHAYAPTGTQPGDAVMPGCKLFLPFSARNDYAYLAIYPELMVLSFRGSNMDSNPMDGIQDWASNFDCRMIKWYMAGRYTMTVHAGFLSGWFNIRQMIFRQVGLFQAVKKMPIVCVGHSRGTIAALCAIELAASYSDVDLLTWGAPLVTAQDGADMSRRLIRRQILYVNEGDPVAGMPLRGPQPHDPAYIRWDGLVIVKAGEPPKPIRYGTIRRAFNRFGHWLFDRMRQPEQSPEKIAGTAYLHDPKLYEQAMISALNPRT